MITATQFAIKRIISLMNDKKILASQLSKGLNISDNELKEYLTGKSEMSIQLLKEISNYFSVTLDYLVGNTSYNAYSFNAIEQYLLSLQSVEGIKKLADDLSLALKAIDKE